MALELPAGRFVATGETTVIGPDVLLSCRLASDAASHPGFEYVAENGMISLTGAFELAEPGTLRFLCFANIGNPKVQMGRLTAVQVAELH